MTSYIGECLKIHNIAFKAEFEKCSEQEDYGFEEEVLNYLQEIIRDVDHKIKQAKDALEEQEESAESEQKAQKIHYLGLFILVLFLPEFMCVVPYHTHVSFWLQLFTYVCIGFVGFCIFFTHLLFSH